MGIATRPPAGRSRVQIPAGSTDFSLFQKFQPGSEAPLGAKATGGAILNISHLVEKRVEIYLRSPYTPSCRGQNFTLLLLR